VIHAGNPSNRVSHPLFSLVQQGCEPFDRLNELVLVVRQDRGFHQVFQEQFNILTGHRTRQITTWFSVQPSYEP